MKKTLLAAALMAGFAGIAQAETSVTLYGVLDTGIGYERIKNVGGVAGAKKTKTGLFDGNQAGNRWGLKGSEDLGNGLRATFQLESGFNLTDGTQAQSNDKTDRLFGRHATVGLAGDSWGQIDFGRQTTVGSRFFVDVHGQHWGGTGSTLTFNAQDTNRIDNSVVYVTPNYSGFQFGAGYSFNANGKQSYKESGVKDQNQSVFTTGLRYANGPMAVALTYDQIRLPVASSLVGGNYTSMKNSNTWSLSGSYDFDVVAVSLAFGQDFDGKGSNSYANAAGNNTRFYEKDYDYNNYSISLAAPVGEGKLSAQYGYKQTRKEAKRAGEANQQQYSIAYTYPLSKRTNVYAYGGYAKNYLNVDDQKRTHGAIGIRHQF